MHEGGFIIDKFKKDNPNLSGEIKLFVDNTGKISGVIVDTTAYILRPLKPVWEIYRDAVNEYLVPDVVKEWMNEKASKAEKGLQQWEKRLTSKQKVVLDTSIDGVKFGGDIVIVGSTTKLAGKLVLEGRVKKILTKADDLPSKKMTDFDNKPDTPHHKTHADTGGHKLDAVIKTQANDYAKIAVENLAYIEKGELAHISELQKVSLAKALEGQALEKGKLMAGNGHKDLFKDAADKAKNYGGNPEDYAKMASNSLYKITDTLKVQTHWVENTKTGVRYEMKVKFYEIKSGAGNVRDK